MVRSIALNEKKLIRRYLIWCYKTTKEELDRIDRKFTQLKVDEFILDYLVEAQKKNSSPIKQQLEKNIDRFREYKKKKEEEALAQKFSDVRLQTPKVTYFYLKSRLKAIEKAIIKFLGKKDFGKIQMLYEEEMTKRILESREHT